MARVISTHGLYEALKAEGFILPDECADVHMTMPIDGLYQLHYTVNLRDEDMIKLGRAFIRMAEESQRINQVVAESENERSG